MKRTLRLSVVATAVLLSMAAPALAHEEITPSTFPTGKPTFLTLSAANERKADLTRIAVAAPPDLPLGTLTRQPAGWTADKSPTQITWTGGKVAPDNFEQWGFEIEGADQPGVLAYKVTMGFADGSSDDVTVEVTAVAAGSPETTIAPTNSTAAPSPTTVAPATTAAPAPTSSSSNDGLAIAALIVALLGGVLAGGALGITLRARRGAGPAKGGSAGAAKEGQDW
jgi:uncharacterized protein